MLPIIILSSRSAEFLLNRFGIERMDPGEKGRLTGMLSMMEYIELLDSDAENLQRQREIIKSSSVSCMTVKFRNTIRNDQSLQEETRTSNVQLELRN